MEIKTLNLVSGDKQINLYSLFDYNQRTLQTIKTLDNFNKSQITADELLQLFPKSNEGMASTHDIKLLLFALQEVYGCTNVLFEEYKCTDMLSLDDFVSYNDYIVESLYHMSRDFQLKYKYDLFRLYGKCCRYGKCVKLCEQILSFMPLNKDNIRSIYFDSIFTLDPIYLSKLHENYFQLFENKKPIDDTDLILLVDGYDAKIGKEEDILTMLTYLHSKFEINLDMESYDLYSQAYVTNLYDACLDNDYMNIFEYVHKILQVIKMSNLTKREIGIKNIKNTKIYKWCIANNIHINWT